MKETRGLRIALSILFGGVIGSVIALQINPLFWWIGALAGFVLGYAAGEFENIKTAVPRAWAEMRPRVNFKKRLIAAGHAFLGVWVIFFNVLFLGMLLASANGAQIRLQGFELLLTIGFLAACSLVMGVLLGAMLSMCMDDPEKDERTLLMKVIYRKANPFIVVFYWLPRLAGYLFCRIPAAAAWTGQFLRRVIVLSHSGAGLFCGLYAAIIAAISFFTHSLLWGVAIGGVLALANYRLITVRWLKAKF